MSLQNKDKKVVGSRWEKFLLFTKSRHTSTVFTESDTPGEGVTTRFSWGSSVFWGITQSLSDSLLISQWVPGSSTRSEKRRPKFPSCWLSTAMSNFNLTGDRSLSVQIEELNDLGMENEVETEKGKIGYKNGVLGSMISVVAAKYPRKESFRVAEIVLRSKFRENVYRPGCLMDWCLLSWIPSYQSTRIKQAKWYVTGEQKLFSDHPNLLPIIVHGTANDVEEEVFCGDGVCSNDSSLIQLLLGKGYTVQRGHVTRWEGLTEISFDSKFGRIWFDPQDEIFGSYLYEWKENKLMTGFYVDFQKGFITPKIRGGMKSTKEKKKVNVVRKQDRQPNIEEVERVDMFDFSRVKEKREKGRKKKRRHSFSGEKIDCFTSIAKNTSSPVDPGQLKRRVEFPRNEQDHKSEELNRSQVKFKKKPLIQNGVLASRSSTSVQPPSTPLPELEEEPELSNDDLIPFDDWWTFEYTTADIYLYFITFSRKRKGKLPLNLVQRIDRFLLSSTRNSVLYTTYKYAYTTEPLYIAYRENFMNQGDLEMVAYLEKHMERYFFAWEEQRSRNMLELGKGNSWFYKHRRDTHNMLNNGKWFMRAVTALCLLGTTLVLSWFVKRTTINYAQRVKNNIKTSVHHMWNKIKHPYSLFPMFPNFTVYFEETIKMVPYGWWFVSYWEFLIYGDWETYKWHKKSSKWSYAQRCNAHFKKNAARAKQYVAHEHEYRVFLEDYAIKDFTEGVCSLSERCFPTSGIPWPGDPESTRLMIKNGISFFNSVKRVPASKETYWFPLCWLLSEMVVPRNSYEIRWMAAVGRVSKVANAQISDWNLYNLCEKIAEKIIVEHIEIPNWIDTLDARQKRNLKMASNSRVRQEVKRTVSVQVKCDEALFVKEKLVPRILTNQSGEEFLAMGKQTSEISLWVHEHLFSIDPIPIEISGLKYFCFFVAGASSYELDNFVWKALTSPFGVWVLVLGDDSLSIVHQVLLFGEVTSVKTYFLENDFSQYDRTQHSLLRKLVDDILERSGYKELVIERKNMYSRKLVFPREVDNRPRPPLVDINLAPADMRYTGEAATCLDNSIINIITFCVCHSQSGASDLMLEANFAHLGLKAKIIRHQELENATFLKGSFLPNVIGRYTWTRLPSFLLKFGKVLTDPHLIIKKKIPYEDKCAMILWGQWLSYGDLSHITAYRFIGERVEFISKKLDGYEEKLKFWQIKTVSPVKVNDDVFDRWLRKRYDMTLDEFLLALQPLTTVVPSELPVTWHSSSLRKLLKDY